MVVHDAGTLGALGRDVFL